ncbi:unnamed protein product [Closterium sp. NIES-53]
MVELFGGIGAGLAAVVKAGVAVKEWIYVEQDARVRKMAENHTRKLQEEFPELLVGDVIERAMHGTATDVRRITRDMVRRWGHVDLLVAGWECQGVSRVGKGKGMDDPRGLLLLDLLHIMDWIKEGQGEVTYLLEHLDFEGDLREPVRRVGEERRAWPTLVAFEGAAGLRMENGEVGEGMVYDHRKKQWEEPTVLERELAMGYGEDITRAKGVTEQERRSALGRAMDGQVMLWLTRRMWKGLVWDSTQEEAGKEAKKVGAWACIPATAKEAEWEVGDAMSPEGKRALKAVLARFRHAFAFTLQELGKCTVKEMELKLMTDEPVFQRKRRMAPGDADICKEKCKELKEAGLIQRSESEYATPTVIAARKDLTGEILSRRMCGDYRALNKVTVPDCYPMPTAEEIFDRLGAGEIFSTLDLRQGFNQIGIKKEDIRKTAFHGADGLYEWLFMPFGLRNASAIFQRVMDSVLRNVDCAACYIDDVVIFSKTEEEHVRDVERTLEALAAAGLTCHPKKCRWGEATVHYLGYEVRGGQIGIEKAKVELLDRLQQPKDRTGLRAVLGFLSYYRRFVPNFSKRAGALNGLLREDRKWEWGAEQQEALKDLMEAVKTGTILQLPQADKPFCLYTDWSSQGMGAVLCQEVDGEERVVAYASRSCNPAEAKYSSYHGEGLAAVRAVGHFRVYLQGREFTLVTDHQPLQWLMTHQGHTGRNARWAVKRQEYDFKIRHRPGKTLQHVDGLSRNPPPPAPEHTLILFARAGEVATAEKQKGPRDIWEDAAAMRWVKGETEADEQVQERASLRDHSSYSLLFGREPVLPVGAPQVLTDPVSMQGAKKWVALAEARARYMKEMLPAALENLHTAQLRDALRYQQRQQKGGGKGKEAVAEGQEVYLKRAKQDTLDVGLGTVKWKVRAVRDSGVLKLENEKGEQTVDHQTNAAVVRSSRPQLDGPVTRAHAARARAQEGAGSG